MDNWFYEVDTYLDMKYVQSYMKDITESAVIRSDIKIIDLTGCANYGGTTISSGVLPKWNESLGNNLFIKSCSGNYGGIWGYEAINECFIYDLFRNTGANVAECFPVIVLFYNGNTDMQEFRFASLCNKFSGELVYYRDLRRNIKLGDINDEFVELCQLFPKIKGDFLSMLVIDYIVNQEDRHSKNFGVIDGVKFSPLYDNGSSFYYSDIDLYDYFIENNVSKFKTTGKDYLESIKRYMYWLGSKPNIDLDAVEVNLVRNMSRYRGIIEFNRLKFMEKLVLRRIKLCREIMR